uniref:Carboxylesterase type B domain-containing protein n=1 Tax=Arcella intermedia TaxID=1963864 RepID=A0A6B2LBL1_9EUKA|eukprot:TRINITY_DN5989_c0_g1_i2.p1 TRINITY_DN5989_c0_g1~~TRINITY_DN5989_c0_g1_i2.p1  ORF type:complete len:301 (+),score=73.44 TRINITY_DN5989_c0_g1_i2:698-1600(+)
MQSDPLPIPERETADASAYGKQFVDQLECNDLDCLRSKTIEEILEVQGSLLDNININHPLAMFLPLVPTIDGTTIPFHFFDAMEKGLWNRVPIIIGADSEDGRPFVYETANFTVNAIEYEAFVLLLFGMDAVSVTEYYPPNLTGDSRDMLSTLITHYIFECPARYVENLIYSHSPSIPIWLYQWDHPVSAVLWGPDWYCWGRVCHSSEVPYEFASQQILNLVNFTAEEKNLSHSIMGHFTNFARTGNPNVGPYQPSLQWPLWDPKNLLSLHFTVPQNTIQQALLSNYCDFFDTIQYRHGW